MIRHLIGARGLFYTWTCLSSKLHSSAAEGEVEPTCDMADGSRKEKDCASLSASNNPPDHKTVSEEDQSKQQPEEMASVHTKNKNIMKKMADGAKSLLGRRKSSDKPDTTRDGSDSKVDLYVASMVLSGVGDAMGYHNGKWEFNYDGPSIHEELKRMGGLDKLHLTNRGDWLVSDDTVMHLATGDALVEFGNKTVEKELYKILAEKYVECMKDMHGRAAGPTTMQATRQLTDLLFDGSVPELRFNSRGGGCGAAMRAMCIGLRYPRPKDLDDLIAVSIESGRLTHHNPTGYLGALVSALFTSYAIQNKSIASWGRELTRNVLPKAKEYIRRQGRYVNENLDAWSYFEEKWTKYLEERQIADDKPEDELQPFFPPNFDVKARDEFYKKYSFDGWGGASGHDAPMIAYDALLGAKDSWTELCLRGMLHGGDNDSTGAIAGAWFGALYELKGVPEKHYKDLEYRKRLEKLGRDIHQLASAKATRPQEREPTPEATSSQGTRV